MQISGMNVYYWQLSSTGILENGLKYKSTFTIMYRNLEAALRDGAPPIKDGEWSIRLWSGLEGLAPEFVEEHKRIVDDLYEELIFSEWNSDKEMDCMYGTDGERLRFHRM